MTNPFTCLITRPSHQAQPLCCLIEQLGGHALSLPTIEIKPPRNSSTLFTIIDHLTNEDLAIFVSANAVHSAIPLIQTHHPDSKLTTLAIGPGTAKALAHYNITVNDMPNDYNSEGLLALPILQNVAGKKLVIFCGANARPLLPTTLANRGALVVEAISYYRALPTIDTKQTIIQLHKASVDFIITTSQESFKNLFTLLGQPGLTWLQAQQFIVINEAMATLAHSYQLQQAPIIAANASDQAIIAALSKTIS